MSSIIFVLATLKARLQESGSERGAGVVEYALVIGGISIVLVLGAVALNTGLVTTWNEIGAYLQSLIP